MREVYKINPDKYKIALLDFTGTLVNTEPLHHRSYEAALAEIDISFPRYEIYRKMYEGKTAKDIFIDILSTSQVHFDIDTLVDKRRDVYKQLLLDGIVSITDGAVEFLHEAKKRNIKLGLVSTSRREEMQQILASLKLQDIFDITLAREDVDRGKPDPQGFIKALKEAGNLPEESVAFEDSKNGFEAVNKSGIEKCFGITQHVIKVPEMQNDSGIIFIRDFRQVQFMN